MAFSAARADFGGVDTQPFFMHMSAGSFKGPSACALGLGSVRHST